MGLDIAGVEVNGWNIGVIALTTEELYCTCIQEDDDVCQCPLGEWWLFSTLSDEKGCLIEEYRAPMLTGDEDFYADPPRALPSKITAALKESRKNNGRYEKMVLPDDEFEEIIERISVLGP